MFCSDCRPQRGGEPLCCALSPGAGGLPTVERTVAAVLLLVLRPLAAARRALPALLLRRDLAADAEVEAGRCGTSRRRPEKTVVF